MSVNVSLCHFMPMNVSECHCVLQSCTKWVATQHVREILATHLHTGSECQCVLQSSTKWMPTESVQNMCSLKLH